MRKRIRLEREREKKRWKYFLWYFCVDEGKKDQPKFFFPILLMSIANIVLTIQKCSRSSPEYFHWISSNWDHLKYFSSKTEQKKISYEWNGMKRIYFRIILVQLLSRHCFIRTIHVRARSHTPLKNFPKNFTYSLGFSRAIFASLRFALTSSFFPTWNLISGPKSVWKISFANKTKGFALLR